MVGEFFSSKLCLASVFSLICFSHPIFAEYDPITYFSRQSSEVKVEPVIPVESEEVAPLIADMDQQNTAFLYSKGQKSAASSSSRCYETCRAKISAGIWRQLYPPEFEASRP